MDSEVRQDLPVDIDVVCFESMNKQAVSQAVRFGSRFDPDDPETPEIPFSDSAVSVGILKGSFNSFFGSTVVAVARPIESFRLF